MKKYKYKVGDAVTYTKLVWKDRECPTCHNVEAECDEVRSKGKVTARQYNSPFEMANGFLPAQYVAVSTRKATYAEAKESGEKMITPYLKTLPIYRIGTGWYPEASLKPV